MTKKFKKQKESIKILLKAKNIKNILTFCLIKISMKRIQSYLHKIGTYDILRFLCLVLMIKGTFLMMALIV